MSVEAITWALRQPVRQSSAKFVLVVLGNQANGPSCYAWPSVRYLCDATAQDRKTVMANLARLIAEGYIEDTGERRGATRRVVVYRLRVEVQRDGDLLTERHYCYRSTDPDSGRYYIGVRSCLGEPAGDASYLGSGRWVQHLALANVKPVKTVLAVYASRLRAEDAERTLIEGAIDDPLCMNRQVPGKRAEIGTVWNGAEIGPPFSEANGPEKPQKRSQKRDPEPKGTVKEPSKRRTAAEPLPPLPEWLESDAGAKAWADFVDSRKQQRAPLTHRAAELVLKTLAELRDQGQDPAKVLDQSTRNRWRDVFPLKGTQPTYAPGQPTYSPRQPDAATVLAAHRAREVASPERAASALAEIQKDLRR